MNIKISEVGEVIFLNERFQWLNDPILLWNTSFAVWLNFNPCVSLRRICKKRIFNTGSLLKQIQDINNSEVGPNIASWEVSQSVPQEKGNGIIFQAPCSWHILGDSLIPEQLLWVDRGILHEGHTKSLTFSRVFPKGCHVLRALLLLFV